MSEPEDIHDAEEQRDELVRLRADVARLREILKKVERRYRSRFDAVLEHEVREALSAASMPVVLPSGRRTCQEILASLYREGWLPDATIAAVLVSSDGTQVQVLWLDGKRAEAEVRRPAKRQAGGAPLETKP